MVCVVGRMRDLILQLSKSSIYSTKPFFGVNFKHEKATFSTPINWKHIKTVSKGRVKAITKPYMKGLVKEIRDIT